MQINNTSVEPRWFIVFGNSQHLGIDFEPFRFNTSRKKRVQHVYNFLER